MALGAGRGLGVRERARTACPDGLPVLLVLKRYRKSGNGNYADTTASLYWFCR